MTAMRRAVYRENPVFVLTVGLCPSLAVATHAVYPLVLGVVLTLVLVLSAGTLVLLREVIDRRIRFPVVLAVVSGYVSIADLILKAYAPDLSTVLGIYVPLLAINALILTGGFAAVRSDGDPAGEILRDAIGTGLGFLLGLTLIGSVREIVGRATLTLVPIGSFDGVIRLAAVPSGVAAFALPAGAFLVVGYITALHAYSESRRALRAARQVATPDPEPVEPEPEPEPEPVTVTDPEELT